MSFAVIVLLIHGGCSKNVEDPPTPSVPSAGPQVIETSDGEFRDDEVPVAVPTARSEYFFLNVGAGDIQKRVDEKNAVFIGGNDCQGQLVVFVNGCPIKIFTHGGALLRLTEWIQGEQNEIVLEGEHAEPVFLRVVTLSTPSLDNSTSPAIFFDRLVAEVVMQPDTNRQQLAFDVGELDRENQTFERFPSTDSERQKVETEMRRIAAGMASAIVAHDMQTVRESFFKRAEFEELRWISDQELEAAAMRRLLSFVQDTSLRLLDKESDLRVVWGERCALMYTDVDSDGRWGVPGAYSFRYESSMHGNGKMQPLKFVRVRGEVILW